MSLATATMRANEINSLIDQDVKLPVEAKSDSELSLLLE